MIQETQVLSLIDPVVTEKKRLKLKKKDKVNTLFYEGYLEYIAQKEQISYHTVKGKKPVEMLSMKAPNQSEEELQYVLNNFKQNTLPVSFEFLSTIGRGLHDGNWSVTFDEENQKYVTSEMTFKQYLDKDIASTPLRMSYDSWMKFVLPSIKINDAMGVVAFKPYRKEVTTTNAEGEEVIAGDQLPEPIPFYYGCERVLSNPDWGYLLIETNEYSVIQKGNKSVREGLVFEVYDDTNIWKIRQVGKDTDWTFEKELYFTHNLGFIPATYLMGIPYVNDYGVLSYQSPFLMVVDILDEVLMDGCNLRSVKASSVYPQKVMLGNPCQFIDEDGGRCDHGYIPNKGQNGYHKCEQCHGTGQLPRTGPTNTLFIKEVSSMDSTQQIKANDALAYISPSTDTPVFLRDEITQGTFNALSILHLKTTSTIVKTDATDSTATGMMMDEKAKYAFIKTVVDQIFDIYEFGLKCMGGMRYGEDFVMPHVNRPTTYDFNSPVDYLNQIAAMQNAGVNPNAITPYVNGYLKAIYYDNPKMAKSYDIIQAADRLFNMTFSDIMQELPRNLIQPYEVVLHDSALVFIAELQRLNEGYLDLPIQEAVDKLIEHSKLMTPASPAPTARLNPLSILENANA